MGNKAPLSQHDLEMFQSNLEKIHSFVDMTEKRNGAQIMRDMEALVSLQVSKEPRHIICPIVYRDLKNGQ